MSFDVLNPPRVLLHVKIHGDPISWERVGFNSGRSYNPNWEQKKNFLWKLKAACPILRPDCVNRIGVQFHFWTAKTSAWNEDIDNFCKFYLDALTPQKPKRRKGMKAFEYDKLVAQVMKTAFGPWADDRQIDKLEAEVHRSAISPHVEILVYELPAARTQEMLSRDQRCADCEEHARHAYSDATTPGFFHSKCPKHREVRS